MYDMDTRVRNVLAKYMEKPEDCPWDRGTSWMEYLKDRSQGSSHTPQAIVDMLQDVAKGENPVGVKDLDKPFSQYNPYEYNDPSSKPKNLKESPPFSGGLPFFPDQGFFFPPRIFKDRGVLDEWYKARRRDWTDDPDEQQPAISILRKKSASLVKGAVSRHIMHTLPIIISESDLEDLNKRTKTAASLKEIINTDTHYKNDAKINRAAACGVTWANKNNKKETEKGLFIFRVRCEGSGKTRLVYFQFLRGKDEERAQSYIEYPVQISCSCESFLWYGAQYYAINGKYLYYPGFRINPGVSMAPKTPDQYVIHVSPRYPKGKRHPGRGLNFRVCKHILATYNHIKGMKVVKPFRRYPVVGPPSKIINADVWKELMKFDFNEKNIKDRLKSPVPKIPAYFRRENITQSVIDWFNEVWIPRSEAEKIKTLKTMVESPEKIFFILMKEAYLKSARGGRISNRLIDEGYNLMERVIQPENKEEPEMAKMPGTPETQKEVGKGTGISRPGGETPADEFIKRVPKSIKSPESPAEEKE